MKFLTERKFAVMDVDHSGNLDETEFAHLLGLPPSSPVVEEIFHLFDKDGDGALGKPKIRVCGLS